MFNGHTILDSKVIHQNGSFSTVKYWLKGWVKVKNAKYIMGITGKETEVIVSGVRPIKTFKSV